MDIGKVKDFVLGKEGSNESLEVKGDTYIDELKPLEDLELMGEPDAEEYITDGIDYRHPSDVKLSTTLNNRGNTYGQFKNQAKLSRKLKGFFNAHIRNFGQSRKFNDSMAEATEMIMHKLSRIANGDPTHIDSWHDIAGYAQLVVEELRLRDKSNPNEETKEFEG